MKVNVYDYDGNPCQNRKSVLETFPLYVWQF